MRIRFTSRNGQSVITCVRDDGSQTYSKSRHGEFFATHDLLHYAVETTLGERQAFFGLIEAGWSIDAFNMPGAAGKLPAAAIFVEHVVNLMMQEIAFDSPRSAKELNSEVSGAMGAVRRPVAAPTRLLTDAELTAIRARFAELLGQFRSLPPGGQLELAF